MSVPDTATLIERAARGLRAARDYTTRQHRDHDFIFGELVPDGLRALDELQAALAGADSDRAALREALEGIASTDAVTRPGVVWVHWAEQARAALARVSVAEDTPERAQAKP